MVSNAARPSSYPFKIIAGAAPRGCAGTVTGALAQLGERLICIQEVIGSIPIGSTMADPDTGRGLGSVAQVVRAHA